MISISKFIFSLTGAICLSFSTLLLGSWSAPQDISPDFLSFNRSPQLAINPSGHVVVIWSGQLDETFTSVQAATFSFGGNWSAPAIIQQALLTSTSPFAAIDPAGNSTVVWQFDEPVTPPPPVLPTIQTSSLVSGSNTWSFPPVDLSLVEEIEFARDPQVALDTHGNAVAVWAGHVGIDGGDPGVDFLVRTSSLPAGDTDWSHPFDISSPGLVANNPVIKLDPNGNAVIVWWSFDGTFYSTLASTLPFDSTTPTPPFTLGLNSTVPTIPQLAINAAGYAVAIYIQTTLADETFVQSSSLLNGTWSPPINIPASTDGSSTPQIGMDSHGNCIAVWQQLIGGLTLIQSSTLPFNGVWTNPVTLSALDQNAETPKIAVNAFGNAVAVWSQTDGDVYATTFVNGSWTPPVVLSTEPNFTATEPKVAIDAAGNTVVAWVATFDDDPKIQAVVSTDLFAPAPPSNFQGTVINDRFIAQTDRIYQLTWNPSPTPSVLNYQLFRNGVLIATIPAAGPYFYNDHNRTKAADTYSLDAVGPGGSSTFQTIIVPQG